MERIGAAVSRALFIIFGDLDGGPVCLCAVYIVQHKMGDIAPGYGKAFLQKAIEKMNNADFQSFRHFLAGEKTTGWRGGEPVMKI